MGFKGDSSMQLLAADASGARFIQEHQHHVLQEEVGCVEDRTSPQTPDHVNPKSHGITLTRSVTSASHTLRVSQNSVKHSSIYTVTMLSVQLRQRCSSGSLKFQREVGLEVTLVTVGPERGAAGWAGPRRGFVGVTFRA